MLSFTIEEIENYFKAVLIFTVLYLILYKYKGINKTFKGYIQAIESVITYAVCGMFVIVGCGLILGVIEQKSGYLGLPIPITWFMLVIYIIKHSVKQDFGINIDEVKVIKYIFVPYKIILSIMEHLVFLVKYLGVVISLPFFLTAYSSRENINQAITLIIVGTIFGIVFGIVGKFVYAIEKNGKETDDVETIKEKDEEK